MKKSLVSLSIAAMVLASSAQADEHSKGTHKGHVHKSVGESCSDKCDDLRRQIEDLNASYQERLQALETSVEELEEVAHEHETLLLDPAEDSWTLGFDVWWADVSGGELALAIPTTLGPVVGGAPTTAIGSPIVSIPDDDAAWTASISFQDEVDSSWNFRYTSADSSTAYAGSSGLAPTGAAPLNFFTSPLTVLSGGGFNTGAFSDFVATRSVDVDDIAFEKESRVWANEKFAVNWNWGLRHADVENRESAAYFENLGGASDLATFDRSSDFSGWGPSAGMRARYYLSDDFEVQGNFGMAALVGENDGTVLTTADFDTTDAIAPIVTGSGAASISNVNPVLDLGSRFVWHAGDDLDVHVGYSVSRYFDAITTFTGAGFTKDDLSLEGIRAGIQWNFD